MLLIGSIYLVAVANTAFWRRALAGRSLTDWDTWSFVAAVAVLLVAVHFLAMVPFATRRAIRPLLLALGLVSAAANQIMQNYGVVLDAGMMRNVLHTDIREAAEVVTADTLLAVLVGVLPLAALWSLRVRAHTRRRTFVRRLAAITASALAAAGALLTVYQDLSALLRTQKELRYTVLPASAIWSLGHVLAADAHAARAKRAPPEAAHRQDRPVRHKPTLLVMVIGETARAGNFSLNGYPRPTNRELAQLEVINFSRVRACGTSTEVSLPCMFSPFGRADYDESRIRRHDSLLHVLSHAGFKVTWLDNQSGCKGVCEGLEYRHLAVEGNSGLCGAEHCYDEILVHELARVTAQDTGDLVVVLHQIGNHGPAYFRRYPDAYKQFMPACDKEQLRGCSRAEIVNAYDNAILYTDHVLARVIEHLAQLQPRFDVAMIYASDHGESLGEKGLFLHGLPYAIAPDEQLSVPMLWWIPERSAAGLGIDTRCLRRDSGRDVSHDNLYHSVLGLLRVETPRYRRERDLTAGCLLELRQ
ncbi:MAG: phosphoethanolamine--lipid A transferase [Burkholderiales bacterium]|nr:phosphoethanolamine--lipid A transferase [Burkholderiales bacterium]